MKKILLVLDAAHVDTEVIHFASNIAILTHSTLTGLFIGNYKNDEPEVKVEFGISYVEEPAAVCNIGGKTTLQQKQEEHIRLFEKMCTIKGIRCQVQCDSVSYAAGSIIEGSRFADLVIMQASTSFEKKMEDVPTAFVKEVLAAAECPVLIAPKNMETIEEIVFAYDGSRSSVFAIKQFTYLFPELAEKKAIILQVNKDDSIPVTEREPLGKWLRIHYSSIGFQVVQGKPSDELFTYLLGRRHTMVVMGAFGRSWLSELFKPTTAGLLLKSINLPFFITHH